MFLMTKQSLNGITNALIARLIFAGYTLRSKSSLISFREIVLNLLAFFVLCSTLIMLIVGSRNDFDEIDRSIRTSLVQENQRVTEILENWVENRKRPIVNLAGMAATFSPERMQTRMEQARTSDRNFLRIVLMDKESAAIAYSPLFDKQGRSDIGKIFADRPYIQVLKQTLKPMLSEVMISKFGSSNPTVIMLAPVISHGVYDGAVGGILSFDRIKAVLERSVGGQDTLYALLDKNGNLIVANHKDQKVMTPFSRGKGTLSRQEKGVFQWIPMLPPNISTIELWGRSHYVTESTIGKLTEWKLILEQPVAPFQKMLYDRYIGKITLLFIVLIVLLATAELISRRIARTNEQLCNLTRDLSAKLESGTSIEWPESGIQDSKDLIANFGEMADSLATRFSEIRQINEFLEQRVKERTYELKVNEERLSTAMEMAHLGYWEYDIAEDLFTFNDHFYNIFRTTANQVGGYTMSSAEYARHFVHPDDMAVVEEETRKAIEANDPHFSRQLEHRMFYADGSPGYISVRFFIVKDTQGRTVRTYGVNQDITEQKRFEESLAKSQAEFKAIFNSISNPTVFTDTQRCIVMVNPAFSKTFGYEFEEVKGRRTDFLYAINEDFEEIGRKLYRPGIVQSSKSYEIQYRRKDGTLFWAESHGARVKDEHGDVIGFFALHHDITERKRMEEELLRAQKLESVGLLAAGIAHDFNNILTTILGNISMSKLEVSPGDEIFDLLSEAETASARAQTLTKQLLTFAKGGMPVKETVSIKDIIKESSLFVLRGSKSRCEFSIPEDLWPADVDSGQISQVIDNIVINANQAMPTGGIIQVAAENLILNDGHGLPVNPGRYIRISIKDQGVGIAEKHLLKVFDPYFTTKQEGSGLGLATTYSIIKKHDGHITVESLLGVGTTFHIYLPASDKIVPEKETDRLITGRGRILVMDDEASLRKMVGRMLKMLGYESGFAKDGAEAIRMYKEAKDSEKPYNAVILDLTIPGGMGGKEAFQKLLEIDPEVKAIVSSGYSDDPVLANFQEYGLKGVIPKPFESRSLGKVLNEVLKGEKLNIGA